LFIADWSYGVIYAVHMTPDGSSYKGEAERFISGAPLPVTDMVINPADQAMYFTIGGRRTQSGLYRVTYRGTEDTSPAKPVVDTGLEQRKLRRSLEALHVPGAPGAVDTAWKNLGHPDRSIRFAARIAIEHQPVATWQQRALDERSNADATITALLALARCGDKSLQGSLIQSLSGLHGVSLTEDQQLAALRVLGLCFIRMGQPDPQLAGSISEVLTRSYPSKSLRLNRELSLMLVYLNDSQVAGKMLALQAAAPTQEEQIHYAYCLRALSPEKWSLEQKKEYFGWFLKTANLRGGHSFSGFLKNIRQEAIDRLTDADREALKTLLDQAPTPAEVVVEAAARPLVKEWKVDDLLAELEAGLSGRDYDNGRKMFTVTACFKCHRFAGDGGIVGPDLTAVSRRYNARTMLESLIEPSKVISDQYEARVFVLSTGKQVIGRVVNLNRNELNVCENMLDPGKHTTVPREQIEESFISKTSMMPTGLLNTLSKDEIFDLIAYLQSGGDPNADVFKKKRVATAP
jgi:putative heme-binding domain-containing protein